MNKTLLSLALIAAFAASAVVQATQAPAVAGISTARHGADDPAGDDRGGHGPGHKAVLARHGADDPAGDDRGGHGPGHKAVLARHGADDPAGDDRGGHGPGHKAVLG